MVIRSVLSNSLPVITRDDIRCRFCSRADIDYALGTALTTSAELMISCRQRVEGPLTGSDDDAISRKYEGVSMTSAARLDLLDRVGSSKRLKRLRETFGSPVGIKGASRLKAGHPSFRDDPPRRISG